MAPAAAGGGLWRLALLGAACLCLLAAQQPAAAESPQEALDRRFWNAAAGGDVEEMESALEEGADIDAPVLMGKDDPKSPRVPALMQATLQGHLDTIEYLLEQGADVEQADGFGFTPIHACAFRGNADACAMLLEHAGGGTSPPATHFHDDGLAPLHRACYEGHLDTVRAFLDAGADPNLPSREDQTGRGKGGGAGYSCAMAAANHPKTLALLEDYGQRTMVSGDPASEAALEAAKEEKRAAAEAQEKKGRKGRKGKGKKKVSMDDILEAHPDL